MATWRESASSQRLVECRRKDAVPQEDKHYSIQYHKRHRQRMQLLHVSTIVRIDKSSDCDTPYANRKEILSTEKEDSSSESY